MQPPLLLNFQYLTSIPSPPLPSPLPLQLPAHHPDFVAIARVLGNAGGAAVVMLGQEGYMDYCHFNSNTVQPAAPMFENVSAVTAAMTAAQEREFIQSKLASDVGAVRMTRSAGIAL